MKIIHKADPSPEEKRIKTKFLLFPKRIRNETRWLEKASWKQRYVAYVSRINDEPMGGEWLNVKWED